MKDPAIQPAATSASDQARVSVTVATTPARTFSLFTEEIDQWWRGGRKYRHFGARAGILCIEPALGGRIFESCTDEDGIEHVFEAGRVLHWEPPLRLVFSWRVANFKPSEVTEVEVEFVPVSVGTRVTVTHRGWDGLPADHPVRHGYASAGFLRMMGMWWGELLTQLRALAREDNAPHA